MSEPKECKVAGVTYVAKEASGCAGCAGVDWQADECLPFGLCGPLAHGNSHGIIWVKQEQPS